MKISNKGIELIKGHEGFRAKDYKFGNSLI